MLLFDLLQTLEVAMDENSSLSEGVETGAGPPQRISIPIEAIEQPVGAAASQDLFRMPAQPYGRI
jgi:hypothetical protein